MGGRGKARPGYLDLAPSISHRPRWSEFARTAIDGAPGEWAPFRSGGRCHDLRARHCEAGAGRSGPGDTDLDLPISRPDPICIDEIPTSEATCPPAPPPALPPTCAPANSPSLTEDVRTAGKVGPCGAPLIVCNKRPQEIGGGEVCPLAIPLLRFILSLVRFGVSFGRYKTTIDPTTSPTPTLAGSKTRAQPNKRYRRKMAIGAMC